MRVALVTLPLFSVLSVSGLAQEAKRQLGTHEHGRGFLNIAIEGNRVSIDLQAPGSDVARSEAKPDTPERKAVVAAAIAQLEKPLELFRLPDDAGCTVSSAKARMTIVGEDEHHAHDKATDDRPHARGHGHDKHAKGEKHAGHGDHKHGEDHRGHADYHGAYQLTCASPARLATIKLPYFNIFPLAEKLSIQIVGPKGQTQVEATKATPIVKLGGAI